MHLFGPARTKRTVENPSARTLMSSRGDRRRDKNMNYIKLLVLGLVTIFAMIAANYARDLAYQIHMILIMLVSGGLFLFFMSRLRLLSATSKAPDAVSSTLGFSTLGVGTWRGTNAVALHTQRTASRTILRCHNKCTSLCGGLNHGPTKLCFVSDSQCCEFSRDDHIQNLHENESYL